jgi:hypothetical protein
MKPEGIFSLDRESKKLFTLGSEFKSRFGKYKVTWVGKDGIKIKYIEVDQDWINAHPDIKFKKKQYITEGFETLRRIDQNIRAEEKE